MAKVDELICAASILLPDVVTVLRNAENAATLDEAKALIADARKTVRELMDLAELAAKEAGQAA